MNRTELDREAMALICASMACTTNQAMGLWDQLCRMKDQLVPAPVVDREAVRTRWRQIATNHAFAFNPEYVNEGTLDALIEFATPAAPQDGPVVRLAPAIKEMLEASQEARDAANAIQGDGYPKTADQILTLCRLAEEVAKIFPGPQSVEAEEVGLKFCCARHEQSCDLIATQRNVVQSILAGAHPKEAWNRVMGDEKFPEAPIYAQGKWISVPLEIDRNHHRAVLGTWNACMAEMATLETTWSRLVTAITGGSDG